MLEELVWFKCLKHIPFLSRITDGARPYDVTPSGQNKSLLLKNLSLAFLKRKQMKEEFRVDKYMSNNVMKIFRTSGDQGFMRYHRPCAKACDSLITIEVLYAITHIKG